MKFLYFFIALLSTVSLHAQVQTATVTVDTIRTEKKGIFATGGTVATWAWYGADLRPDVWLGGRYLTALTYRLDLSRGRTLDFELTSNFYGTIGLNPFRRQDMTGYIHPYRAFGRYTTERIGITIGRQEISFGPSSLFRPLKWFDSRDARDPLDLSKGQWAALFQYKFPDRSSIWVWGMLYDGLRDHETVHTQRNIPEAGARGELALGERGYLAAIYHFRRIVFNSIYGTSEHKIGLDGQYTWGADFWFEASWTMRDRDFGRETNRVTITLGADWMIPVGKGLELTFEQMIHSADRRAFAFNDPLNASGLSLDYPVLKNDHLSVVAYYDWNHRNAYGFFDWEHRFKHDISLHLLGYWNPKVYRLPNADDLEKRFAGKGVMLMFVWNY